MALSYSFVIPPFGGAENYIVKEMFDDITKYFATVDALYVKLIGDQTITGDIIVVGNPFTVRSAEATTEVAIDNTATDGDPYLSWNLSGTRIFCLGVNDGSSDVLQLGTTAIDTATMLQATAAGQITQPLQPCFLITGNGGSSADVTGDGTSFAMTFATEVYDAGSNVSGVTFTAPVTGSYYLSAGVIFQQILVAHASKIMNIVTSNRTYAFLINQALAQATLGVNNSVMADMDTNDTATITVSVDGSTKTVDMNNSGANSRFCGSLIN